MLRKATSIMIATLVVGASYADDEFNPSNPPEPNALYKLTVQASPAEWGYASGGGRYGAGEGIYIYTSSRDASDYEFSHWELDGSFYTNYRSFYYTMPESDATLTAVYREVQFNPSSPSDPMAEYYRRVYVECDPEESCSFNFDSGSRYTQGSTIYITAHASQGFKFLGWWEGSEKLGEERTLPYTVPDRESHLTARFVYSPDSPADPQGGQSSVDTGIKGDVNGDGTVDVSDAADTARRYLNRMEYLRRYDVNGDGTVDASDVTAIINIYLNK